MIKFDPGVIDDAAAAITGMPGEAGAATLPRIELSSSAGRSFLGLFSEFRQALLDPEHLIHRPALGRQMEAVLCTALLLAQSPLEGRAQTVHVPAYVRRAREYLHDHVGEAVTAADLATHVRVGARTLFAAFSAIYGASPMAYLRELRLRAVHEELLARADDPSATVTDIGLRWGVTHQSRFAATYRLRYGRLPSHELRAVAGASNRRS